MKEKTKASVLKTRIIPFILWLIWLSLTMLSFYNAAKIRSYYPKLSLRYDKPVTQLQAISARKYSAQQSSPEDIWPSFYYQSTEEVKSNLKQTNSICLWYSGNGNLVWPAKFITGSYPGEISDNTICVSSALAWELWGDYNVTGLAMIAAGEEYNISGVFKHSEALALISCGNKEPPAGSWQAVVLQTMNGDNLLERANEYAAYSGLGMPDSIIRGTTLVAVLYFFAAMPTVILLICIFMQLFYNIYKRPKSKKGVIIFAAALIFAFSLPWLLSLLPDKFIPNQWSDFSFWGRLFENGVSRFIEWLALNPLYTDVQVKLVLIIQMLIFFVLLLDCVFCLIYMKKLPYK